MSVMSAIGDFFGWYDGEKYKTADKNNNYNRLAELDFYNGYSYGFYRNLRLAGGGRKSAVGDLMSDQRAQVDYLTMSSAGYYVNVNNEIIFPEILQYNDGNGNGRQDAWEKYQTANTNANGQYIVQRSSEPKTSVKKEQVFFLNMVHPKTKGGLLSWGLNFSQVDYSGSRNASFILNPWINNYTPQYLVDLNGESYPLLRLDPVMMQKAYINYSLATFSLWPKMPIVANIITPMFINRINIGGAMTHTGANITTFGKYEYNEALKNMVGEETLQSFSSWKGEFNPSVESRTFAAFKWPYQAYISLGVGANMSWLFGRSMADMYQPIDDAWMAPEYYKDIPYRTRVVNATGTGYQFDDQNGNGIYEEEDGDKWIYNNADIDAMTADHNAYMQKRKEAPALSAMNTWFKINSSWPFIKAICYALNWTSSPETSREKLQVSLGWSASKDYIVNTFNGLFPSRRNTFPVYTKFAIGDVNQDGIQNGDTDADGVEEAGETWTEHWAFDDFTGNGIKDANEDYQYGAAQRTSLIANDDVPAAESSATTLTFSYAPKLFGEVYWANQGSVSWIKTKDPLSGDNKDGLAWSVGTGINIGDTWEFKYMYSASKNGYNYENSMHTASATLRF